MNINDLNPDDYTVSAAPLNISNIDPKSYTVVSGPKTSGSEPGFMDQPGQWTVNHLPEIGGIAGAVAGSPLDAISGPGGNILGAGLGGAAGNALKGLIQQYQNPTTPQAGLLSDIGQDMKSGGIQAGNQALGEYVIGPAVGKAAGLVSDAASAAKQALTPMASKIGQNVTGMSKSLTQNYIENTAKINDLIGTWGENAADFAADMRTKWMDAVQSAKSAFYETRDQVVRGAQTDTNIDITPVIDKLESAKSNLNSKSNADAISQIDRDINLIKNMSTRNPGGVSLPVEGASTSAPIGHEMDMAGLSPSTPVSQLQTPMQQNYESMGLIPPASRIAPNKTGPWPSGQMADFESMAGNPIKYPISTGGPAPSSEIENIADLNAKKVNPYNISPSDTYSANLQDLHAMKAHLQSVADGSYNTGGQIFTSSSGAQNAARGAAAVARGIFIDSAPKAASEAESKLAALHGIENDMNSNLLNPNGPINVLTQAGSNPGGVPARTLKELGKIVPYDFAQDAKDFATAQAFANPGMTPMDTTGKSVARQLLTRGPGALGGYFAGKAVGHPDVGFLLGQQAGTYLASPALMKAGINTGNALSSGAQGILNTAPAAARLLGPRIMTPGLLNRQGIGQ